MKFSSLEMAMIKSSFPVLGESILKQKKYITEKSLLLMSKNVIGISRERAREVLFTGYLSPLFSEKNYIEDGDFIKKVLTQRTMEFNF